MTDIVDKIDSILDEGKYDPGAKTHVVTSKELDHESKRFSSAMASRDADKYIAQRLNKTTHINKLIAFGHNLEDQNYHDEAAQARQKAIKLGAKKEHVYNYKLGD